MFPLHFLMRNVNHRGIDTEGGNYERDMKMKGYQTIDFNIYTPNILKTSLEVQWSSNVCGQPSVYPSSQSACPYQVQCLSIDTSSTGILVKNVLHLITDDNQPNSVKANITFGYIQVHP